MDRFIIALILLSSICALGQNKSLSKKDDLINKTIGTWEFRPGEINTVGQKGSSKMYFETWHTIKIEFLPNQDYIFIFSDSTSQIGKWDISTDRKELLLFNRKDIPKKYDELPDLKFPIKNKDKFIVITYSVNVKPDYGDVHVDMKYYRAVAK